jgi:hypothetical protein
MKKSKKETSIVSLFYAPRMGSAPFFQGVLSSFWGSFDGVRV